MPPRKKRPLYMDLNILTDAQVKDAKKRGARVEDVWPVGYTPPKKKKK